MKTCLILGASGFIGSHLAERLLQNYNVVGYDIRCPQNMNNPNFRFIQGNFNESEDFASIIRQNNISVVYHCISTTTPQQGTIHIAEEIKANVIPTINLLEAACECGIERLVFLSSGGTVYGESMVHLPHKEDEQLSPVCSYGIQKASIENYMQLYRLMHGLNTVVVRISNPYGVCQTSGRTQGIIPIFIRQLISGNGITLYGNTIRDYIYIDDVVDALCKLIDYNGSSSLFNIGYGQGIYLEDVVKDIESIVGKPFSHIERVEIRNCDVQYSVLDNSLAERDLHWKPTTSLKDGIRMVVEKILK